MIDGNNKFIFLMINQSLFSSNENSIENLRNLVKKRNADDDFNDDNENLVQFNEEEETNFDEIQNLISNFLSSDIDFEADDSALRCAHDIEIMNSIQSKMEIGTDYPQSLIPIELFEKSFIFLGGINQNLREPTLLMLKKIVQCFYGTDIANFFSTEVLQLLIHISDDNSLSLNDRYLAFDTLMEVFFSSRDARHLSYPYLADLFMITKKLSNYSLEVKMCDLIEISLTDLDQLKSEIGEEFFIDFLKEASGWDIKESQFIRLSLRIIHNCKESISSLFSDESNFFNYINRHLNSDRDDETAAMIPLVDFLLKETDILNTSTIEMVVSCVKKLWKSLKYSKDSLEFSNTIVERCPVGVDILIRNQFIEDILDIFEMESPMNAETKISAAKALCVFVINCDHSQLEQIECDKIIDILEEFEAMDLINQDIIEQAHSHLCQEEAE